MKGWPKPNNRHPVWEIKYLLATQFFHEERMILNVRVYRIGNSSILSGRNPPSHDKGESISIRNDVFPCIIGSQGKPEVIIEEREEILKITYSTIYVFPGLKTFDTFNRWQSLA